MEHEGVRDESYRVGWICSFPFELEAALMMLDEESADLPPTANNTPDGYWKGRISGHNIVIAGPPEGMLGVMSAAVTVSQMLLRFKSIRFALIVGIGSGVPSDANDVRLGDVVVSQPRMTQGGVIQYDIGRDFVRTGFVNSPPSVLLDALATVQDNTSYLTEYLSSLPKEFARDHTWPDNLFEPTYRHVQGERTCDMCDKSRLAERRPRQSHDPKVHFGTIASGNHVIKDGNLRDRLSSALGGVLCTQVEATGVMNDFPCLVIRGICDYADSHKTSTWQMYAATAAAVVSKQILSVTPPIEYDWGLTLLHRAAQAGNVTAVESLLESGADPNSRDIKGWTPLHYAAGRGDPKILKLLLGWRADVLLPTWSGKFARDFASVLWQKDVLNILDDPPRISAPKTQNIQECPECDPRCKTVCGSFYPRVEFYRDGPKRDHKTESKKSVHEIIYGNGLEFWEKNTRIWIHLPASNVLWVKDLIRKLCHIREKTVWECRAILDFIDESFCERRGPNFYTFCRDPSCQWDKTKTKLSLVVPYIDMESEPYLERRIPTSDHFKKMQNLMADYPSEIYSSQTLAHSYYETSANVRDRDYKQVVYQYTKGEIVDSKSNQASVTDIGPLVVVNQEEGHFPVADQKSVAKLLMVNQLWLWKIDKETVITASPERWHEGNEWTFQRELLRARPERLFESMDACVRHIVFRCINFSEEPCRAGLDHLYTAIFAYSIAGVSSEASKCYEKWNTEIEPGGGIQLDIKREIELILKLKDIRQDLHMLKRVLDDQNRVGAKLLRYMKEKNLEPGLGTEARSQHIKRMDEEAERVEKSLNHLLDWKQKLSNLATSRAIMSIDDMAKEDGRATKEMTGSLVIMSQNTETNGKHLLQISNAAKQDGEKMKIMTILTIIFLPFTFVAVFLTTPMFKWPDPEVGSHIIALPFAMYFGFSFFLGLVVAVIMLWHNIWGELYKLLRIRISTSRPLNSNTPVGNGHQVHIAQDAV